MARSGLDIERDTVGLSGIDPNAVRQRAPQSYGYASLAPPLYHDRNNSPLEPWFNKTWRPGEIEPV